MVSIVMFARGHEVVELVVVIRSTILVNVPGKEFCKGPPTVFCLWKG